MSNCVFLVPRRWRCWAMSLLMLLVLSACLAAGPEPTPEPTEAPVFTPTDVPTPEPTATPTSVTETPTPAARDDLAPFTGFPVDNPEILGRRPLAIKISNSPEVRPHSGLIAADIVVEHLSEGGITRFTAIYHSQGSERVGSMRSARLIDLELPVIFDAVFAFSGAVGAVRLMIYDSDFGDRVLEADRGAPGMYRTADARPPNNLFGSTTQIWAEAERQGWNQRPNPPGWTYDEALPAGGTSGVEANIPYPVSPVRYVYSESAGLYQRFMVGASHADRITGRQISPANVVIFVVPHITTLIVEDTLGARSIEIQLWGEGTAFILRDGQVFQGRWQRPGRHEPLRLVDADGNDIPLKPGPSWFQMVPLDMQVTIR